jgi:protoporphyrinogen oxidase
MDSRPLPTLESNVNRIVIIGAGPAGLTAAYTLIKMSPAEPPLILESGERVGGISRTEVYKGYRFDIGGHRFFSKVDEVVGMWKEVLGNDLLRVPRLSRIYYRGRFFDYPIKLANALYNLGAYESLRVLLSYLKWQVRPSAEEKTMAQWVINRFGGRLYMHFFNSYTRKVWGISAKKIKSDWAAQRIKSLTLSKAIWNAVTGGGEATSLIAEFDYPRLGPGMMWERTAELVESAGANLMMKTRVKSLHREGFRITGVEVESTGKGVKQPPARRIAGRHFISTMPLSELILQMDPPAPPEIQDAARGLTYRDFLIVALILDYPDPFPDNWIYIHSPLVKVGRIQNFRAWSREMVPNPNHCSIGMEYFCSENDSLWSMADDELIALASQELAQIGLAPASAVIDGTVIRQSKAYPVYDHDYKERIDVIRGWLNKFQNLTTIGRNGMHRYNNQDHSMLSGMLAVRNLMGENHDLWDVNTERSYYEEFKAPDKRQKSSAA